MRESQDEQQQNPLAFYRAQATFQPEQLKNYLDNEESLHFKEYVTNVLREDPLFRRDWKSLDPRSYQELNHKRWKKLVQYDFIENNCFGEAMERVGDLMDVLDTYDQGLSNRYFLSSGVFCLAILTMGTERHHYLIQKSINNHIVGCFCLTELGHGTNIKDIETTCYFEDGHFVLHTPHLSATKCWAGNLSYSATHAIVYAQLYTDNICRGLHAFCIQIRDLVTLEPLPTIKIGDMGEKAGEWNGVENGWMKFDHHIAPLECLLNRAADVTAKGEYIQNREQSKQQQSRTLGTISFGRITLVGKAALAMRLSAAIAIRYSAVRMHSSGNDKKTMESNLELPMQQHRIFPILSSAVAYKVFYNSFYKCYIQYLDALMDGKSSDEMALLIREIHALSCATKAVTTTAAVKAISESRSACGGHGCLKCSRLYDLYNTFDSSQTYEGDNNVLLQQSANILVSLLEKTDLPASPIGSFLVLHKKPLPFNCWENDIYQNVVNAYEWLICHLANEFREHVKKNLDSGSNRTLLQNTAYYNYCQPLAIAYAEYTILKYFSDSTRQAPPEIKTVLETMLTIYATSTIEKHTAMLHICGFCKDSEWNKRLNEELFLAESKLKPNAVSIIDAISPDDFLLHSLLGKSDGHVYEHLLKEFESHTITRPQWWADLAQFLNND